MRGDLESVLYAAVREKTPIQFKTSIRQLNIQPDGVVVDLSNGNSEKYDLLIGAGGIHSNVRQLVWGDEKQFNRFLGFYVACSVIENFFGRRDVMFGHFEPDMQATVYSISENELATFFAFRSKKRNVHGHQAEMEVLNEVLGNAGWVVPELLEGTKRAHDFFFDAVAQIQLDTWYKERVALVGDACQCLTLLAGQGASMALAGAYLFADELHKAEGDYKVAFPSYQRNLQPEINRRQKDARGLAGSFVPRNNFEINLSHFFLKAAFWPGFRSLFAKQIGARSIIK